MAKLMKLRSVLKKLNSFSSRSSSSSSISSRSSISPAGAISSSSSASSTCTHPVHVGKSRRLYHVTTDVIHHPLFQELVERSSGGGGGNNDDTDTTAVSCEVVLFEHLLWMLQENADDSLDGQLADFYAC